MAKDNSHHTLSAAVERGDRNNQETGDNGGTQMGIGMDRRVNHHVCTEDCNSPCPVGQ